jgi:hypothetical protein
MVHPTASRATPKPIGSLHEKAIHKSTVQKPDYSLRSRLEGRALSLFFHDPSSGLADVIFFVNPLVGSSNVFSECFADGWQGSFEKRQFANRTKFLPVTVN